MRSIITYYISNKGIFEECDKEENAELIWAAATASCLERRLQNILSNVTYSPSQLQAGATVINIQSKHFARLPICIKMFHSQCYLVATINLYAPKYIYIYIYIYIYTGCPRRNVPDFGRVFLMLKYTDITQNTHVQSWTVTDIMAREVWNFDSCYTLIDYQIHIKTGRNMWFL